MPPDPRHLLARRWVHSHEEDTPEGLVYRPETFAFPLSRGRSSFRLGLDQDFSSEGPGPADAPTAQHAHWTLVTPDEIEIQPAAPGGRVQRLRILAAEPDRLVLARATPPA